MQRPARGPASAVPRCSHCVLIWCVPAAQPGALLAADLPALLLQALGLLSEVAVESWPPAAAAFAATCSALAAVLRRGAGCREAFLGRCPHVEEELPALLSGHRAVQAARHRICSALYLRRAAASTTAVSAAPDAAAVAAAEAAASALLAVGLVQHAARS